MQVVFVLEKIKQGFLWKSEQVFNFSYTLHRCKIFSLCWKKDRHQITYNLISPATRTWTGAATPASCLRWWQRLLLKCSITPASGSPWCWPPRDTSTSAKQPGQAPGQPDYINEITLTQSSEPVHHYSIQNSSTLHLGDVRPVHAATVHRQGLHHR